MFWWKRRKRLRVSTIALLVLDTFRATISVTSVEIL